MKRHLVLNTPPAIEPVSLSDMKVYLKIESSTDDGLITSLIISARQECEDFTKRSFINRQYIMYMDKWSEGRKSLNLLGSPIVSLEKVELFDEIDQAIIWNTSNYYVDTASISGRLVLRNSGTVPISDRCANGIAIYYTAGYGVNTSDIPEPIISGIKQMVAYLYENRGDDVPQKKVPRSVYTLWQNYRLMEVS